ncbi:MAG TPA: PKD domain-containing protein [Rectinemataceae bacterium]|nr:PKD domain-containing protein [Rectinemataceae bacterium]
MRKSPATNRFHAFKKIAVVFLMMLAAAAPVFGQIKSARARVLNQIPDVRTTKKANFGPGDILGTSLISITAQNGAAPAYLLLKLKIDFGEDGAWKDDFVEASMVKRVESNASFSFTNKDITNSIGDIRTNDFSMSRTLVEHTGITGFNDIMKLKMPEGIYSISLTVTEITLSDPTNINSSYTEGIKWIREGDSNSTIKFKVVTIGAISVEHKPKVDELYLKFKVPEIPVYTLAADGVDSKSETELVIKKGSEIVLSETKALAKSTAGSSAIKGYPSGTDEGSITYDLSKYKNLFRAGESYTFTITFKDWDKALITDKSDSFSFDSVKMSISESRTEFPYRPQFSWSFTTPDYSSWVSEYRLFIDGVYKGKSSGNSFQMEDFLSPSTTYKYYVMPYNKDGTAFLASGAGLEKSFTTDPHTKLDAKIDKPKNNGVLIKDTTYGFSGTATYYDEAKQKAVVWQIGAETKTGLEISYKPGRRYAGNSLSAYLKVTDSFDLASTSSPVYLTVLDPAIAIKGESSRTVDKGKAVLFELDSQNTRDLASYKWIVGGSEIGTGSQLNYTFPASGTYEVTVVGTTVADVDGNTKSFTSKPVSVTVAGAAPVVSISRPASGGELILGNSVNIVAAVTHENELSGQKWSVSGPDASQSGAEGGSLLFKPNEAGEYAITCVATDIFGKTAEASIRILVIDPNITITSPSNNAIFSISSVLTPKFNAPNADRIVWYLGGKAVNASSYALSLLGEGKFELYAAAYWNSIDVNGVVNSNYFKESERIIIEVIKSSPPTITIEFPKKDTILKTGEKYTFSSTTKVGSNLTGFTTDIWWVINGAKSAVATETITDSRDSSIDYTPPVTIGKSALAISSNAKNSDGIEAAQSLSVRLINPAVYLSAPPASEYPVGAAVPINASAVDADLYWIVDGGTPIKDWNKVFTTSGAHTIRAQWKATAASGSGGSAEFSGLSSNTVTLTIYGTEPPAITSFSPSNLLVRETIGVNTTFSLAASGDNPPLKTTWQIVNSGSQALESTGASLTHAFDMTGQYTVRGTVTDSRGLSTSKEWTVKIINPSIKIIYPTTGILFGLNAIPSPVVESQDLSSYVFKLGGAALAQDFNWNSLGVGSFSLVAEGSYAVSSQTSLKTIASAPVLFSVENKTPPSFSVEGVKDGDRIVAGQQYKFTVNRSGAEVFEWYKNGTLMPGSGLEYFFTPVASDREISFAVKGKLNNITVEKAFKVRVIDPYLSIVLPDTLMSNGLFPSQTAIPLQLERRDIDRVEWFLGTRAHTGQTLSLDAGSYTISVRGFAIGVRLPGGSYGEFGPVERGVTSRAITVAPRPSITGLTAPATLYTGQVLNASIATAGDMDGALISSLTWTVDGKILKQEKAPVSKNAVISDLPAGRHAIAVTLADIFGNRSSSETAVTVYKPLILSITQPASNASISPDTNVLVAMTVTSGQYSTITWKVNGTAVANSNFTTGYIGKLGSGVNDIAVIALDPLGKESGASVKVEVPSDFRLSLVAPSEGAELILGNSITAMVALEKGANSSVNLNDIAQNISWLVDDVDTGTKGATYKFTGNSAGDHTIQARYEFDRAADMIRTTAVRKISVREIATPVIKLPLNGASITYSIGDTIALSASGEPGATFSWLIDGAVVAMGGDAVFNPNGMAGQKQLRLVTSAMGRTLEKLATINLTVNSPPSISLSAPGVQYTGDALNWTVAAFDAEDQSANSPIELFFDGVKLANGSPRMLGAGDIGQHTLSVKATDSQGMSATKQVSVAVESGLLPIEIQSPMPGTIYYSGYDLRLMASLAGPAAAAKGSFGWTVQYLDDPTIAAQTFTGDSVVFRPAGLGETAITAKFADASGRDRGARKISVTIEREPLKLSIYWPHGSVVNAGETLTPSLMGLPANAPADKITWTLNGKTIDAVASLKAPQEPGLYSLMAQYAVNGSIDRAEIMFTVNGPPKVTITNLVSGGQYIAGNPIVLSAKVEDDQPYAGTIAWTTQSGSLGEGNPFALQAPAAGDWQITATAVDKYGLSASSTVPVKIYAPIANISAIVNGGLAAYLLAEDGNPLNASVSFAGGISPKVSWILRQGELSVEKSGLDASFEYGELKLFAEGSIGLSLTVSDSGLADESAQVVLKRDYPMELTANAIAELVSPAAGDLFWVGEAVPVKVAVTGFNEPSFSMEVGGTQLATSAWTPLEGKRLYSAEIPAAALQNAGVFELNIAVGEKQTVRAIPSFTLNVYQKRSGIFVDNAPAEIDLDNEAGTVSAVIVGLGEGIKIQWHTDLSTVPAGDTATLDLKNAGLIPGERSITAEAVVGEEVVSSFTFPLKVYGAMTLRVTPESELLILQRGAAANLEAVARDRDGTILTDASITWTSHLDGLVGTGASLNLGALADLSGGEHIFTIEATGKNGSTVTVLKKIQINVAAEEKSGEQEQNDDGGGSGAGGGSEGVTDGWGQGRPIEQGQGARGPMGPGGRPIGPRMLSFLKNKF